MKKNTRVILVTILCILGSISAYSAYRSKPLQERPSKEKRVRLKSEKPIPEHIVYGIFFQSIVDMKEQALETERSGKNPTFLRSRIQNAAGLDQSQAQSLDEIASKTVADISALDLKAEAIINEFRSQFPNGRVPVGTKLPPPPASLNELQLEREGIILAARSRVQFTLGEAKFGQLKEYVTTSIARNIKPLSVK